MIALKHRYLNVKNYNNVTSSILNTLPVWFGTEFKWVIILSAKKNRNKICGTYMIIHIYIFP